MEKFTRQEHSKDVVRQSAQEKRNDEADIADAKASLKRFQLGQRVRLHGLSCTELNDAQGIVIESETDGRITVKLSTASSPKVLQQHCNGIRVKWQNVDFMSKRPISSITKHFTMYADDDTGRSLTLAETQAKYLNLRDEIERAHESGFAGSPIRLFNADLRTNTDHMAQSDARQFLQYHICNLRNAHQLFAGYGPPVNMIDAECVSLYETLFADMRQHSTIWNVFFENIKNTVWCERSVGVLNTYATVLRQRVEHFRESRDDRAFETLSHCERVLNLGGKLIKRYKQSLINPRFLEVAHSNDAARLYLDQKCVEGLTYRYLLIKHNLLMQTGRGHNTNPSEMRFLCELELDPTSGSTDSLGQSGNRLAVLMEILERPRTRRALVLTTDAEIVSAYKLLAKRVAKDSDFGAETTVPNRMCGRCGCFEEERNGMKRCGRCLIEFYCSAECQSTAWPDHQHVCNPPS